MKFDYYLFNSYIPEADGDGPALYRKWMDQVIAADELGFGCAWFTEHHFRPVGGMLPNPSLFIAAVAQHTRRIRLGTAVILLPLRNPVCVAEDVAMLDILSGGRINVGIGRGMDTEFHPVFAVDPATAPDRFDEALSMLQAAFRAEPLTWDGRYFQCPNPITLFPRPVQQPHPPLWVPASRNPEHAQAIGRAGVNLMTLPWQPATFAVTRRVIDAYREGVSENGAAGAGLEVMGYMPVYVGETPKRAREEAEPARIGSSRRCACLPRKSRRTSWMTTDTTNTGSEVAPWVECETSRPYWRSAFLSRATRYTNPEFDTLLESYFNTIPKSSRAEVVAQIVHHMTDQVIWLSMFHRLDVSMLSHRVLHAGPKGEDATQAWNAHEWEIIVPVGR